MAAFIVVEKCSRTKSTLRVFSSSSLAIGQNLEFLIQFFRASKKSISSFNQIAPHFCFKLNKFKGAII
jgi:hypothetical protein